ncbi:MAG: HD domain-containing protein [Planctomycetia bacterium]|nr:HD domain-containing protein [Planctomycetia bacterium]
MPRAKPTVVRLHELTPGQHADFFALLAERTRGATRDGKPFYTCRFRDLQRTVSFMVWADGGHFEACEGEWKVGQFFKIRGMLTEHERYGLQVDVQQLRPVVDADRAEGFEPAEFVEGSRCDADAMLAELRAEVEKHIADVPLRRLVLTILDRHAEPLKRLPATQRHFYPFPGGLLEHTLSVTRSCIDLAERYAARYPDLQPPLNRDLVTAGAALHDIGRVLELTDELIEVRRTPAGGLLGHLFLAQNLVRDTARELGDVNPELLLLLEHLIISHLNHPEWGSPRLPLLPECLILHHADDLDAKLEMYTRCLMKDRADGPFTDRDPALGKQLFKGRTV